MIKGNLNGGQNVGVTGVQDRQGADSEQLTDHGTQLVVTTLEVEDGGLRQHGVVLQLRLSQDGGVGRDDDQLSLTGSQGLDNRLVTKGVLTGLDSKTDLGVHVFTVLGGLSMLVRFAWGHSIGDPG